MRASFLASAMQPRLIMLSRPMDYLLATARAATVLCVVFATTLHAQTPGGTTAAASHLPPKPNNGCTTTGSFEPWLAQFRIDAQKAGIKPQTINAALAGITYDPGIISRDRRQGFFSQSFLDFQAKLATNNRVDNGRRQIQRHKAIFDKAEKQYGVPPEVIAGFWALESDFGAAQGMGNLPVLRSLATLAFDCRRGEYFRGQLIDALRIVERGDLTPQEMVGSWAGELGQTQFLPTYYFKYGVDYDGDRRVDLYRSIPDVIGTSANFVKELGWQAGQPWLEEVRVPQSLAWEQADLEIKHPRSQWAKWGVTRPDGRPLPADTQPASLLLLMGRNGPAFLAYPNFDVYIKWNQSLNYATTAAYLGTLIAGAPRIGRGNAQIVPLTAEQMKELQTMLNRRGFNAGEPDGRLGAGTRVAVRAAQQRLAMPADGYPSFELLERLRVQR
jgi:lytic murein transglycosylase